MLARGFRCCWTAWHTGVAAKAGGASLKLRFDRLGRWQWMWGLAALCGSASSHAELSFCGDPDPPPSLYWVKDADGQRSTNVSGYAVELIRLALPAGQEPRFIGMPWARCLREVEQGRIDFAMGGYYDAERAKRFDYSRHYRSLTPQVFFRADAPLELASKADLRKYRGCGMASGSYAHYGLKAAELQISNSGYEGMIRMLLRGRCDFFVEELELISNFKYLGKDFLSIRELAHAELPDVDAPAAHLLTMKDGPAAGLLPEINAGIERLIRSGDARRLWLKHGGEMPFKP
ncbi:transporter substrate-binding domain-containing protein [Paucibacter sediminis]|uniref:Transporter substrate-binding domain-containing protein n=1 Tax=Paucibacter sediminis TaxID=3019553 RepID=A0AA95NIN0_9BURK|nr:transporter substrate-binding domain-containing protein [Paucibacter sp. S2-9]WIT11581.1 transporter substrate-binding domain-containing protein [Paucibacter sp. S2-9]